MDSGQLLDIYRQMLVIRRLDEMCLELKQQDLIMNGFHPYSGQEAVAVGVCSILRPDDAVVSTHRPQGHSLAKGATPRQIFCEMLGRRGGTSQGIGGPMNWIDAPNCFFSGSIVGSGITIAAGVGLAMQHEGKGRLCVCFFGDGSSNTGSFHEGVNLAAIWKLPVLYILENNQYGEAMPVEKFVPVKPVSKRAEAYGLQGVTVDGMDVEAVAEAAARGAEQCRAGEGPVFIEAITYRFKGHYGGDPEHTYRTQEEVEQWRKKDPLPRLRSHLLQSGAAEAEVTSLEEEVEEQLQSDRAWALEQPFPTLEQAVNHVWIPLR